MKKKELMKQETKRNKTCCSIKSTLMLRSNNWKSVSRQPSNKENPQISNIKKEKWDLPQILKIFFNYEETIYSIKPTVYKI